jgi:hypothetical protein
MFTTGGIFDEARFQDHMFHYLVESNGKCTEDKLETEIDAFADIQEDDPLTSIGKKKYKDREKPKVPVTSKRKSKPSSTGVVGLGELNHLIAFQLSSHSLK